jgi:hypothetical protein
MLAVGVALALATFVWQAAGICLPMRNFFDSPADRQLELNDASATSGRPCCRQRRLHPSWRSRLQDTCLRRGTGILRYHIFEEQRVVVLVHLTWL